MPRRVHSYEWASTAKVLSRMPKLVLLLALGFATAVAAQEADPVTGGGDSPLEIARTAQREGDLARARRVLEQALSEPALSEPASRVGEDELLRLELGLVYEQLGERAEAVRTLREVLERAPRNQVARHALERLGAIGWRESEVLDRADSALARGRYREAAYLYERHLQGAPESLRALLGLARCREGMDRADDALVLYRRALGLAPDSVEVRRRLASLEGAAEPAAPEAETAVPGDPAAGSVAGDDAGPKEVRPRSEAGPSSAEPGAGDHDDRASLPSQSGPGMEPRPSALPAKNTDRSESSPGVAEENGPPGTATASAQSESQRPDSVGLGAEAQTATDGRPRDRQREPAAVAEHEDTSVREVDAASSALPYLGGALALAVASAGGVAIWRARRPRRKYTLAGRLDQLPLHDVLQLIGMERKTGVLEVRSPAGPGCVRFQEGRVVHAEDRVAVGEQALFAILSLQGGDFSFFEEPLPPDGERELAMPVERALMEWAKSVDDSRREDDGEAATDLKGIADDLLNQDLPF